MTDRQRIAARPATASDLVVTGIVALLGCATLAPRLIGLTGFAFTEDELFHAEMVRRPLSFILHHGQYTPMYPAWYLPYKAWNALVGGSDMALRSFSLLFGVLGVAAVWGLARRTAGPRAGVLAALLLALTGYHVHYSQIATPYAFLCLLGALLPWTLIAALDGRRLAAALHALLLAVALCTHTCAALFLAAEVAAILLLAIAGRRQHLRAVLASVGCAVVLAGGALYLMLKQWQAMEGNTFPWIGEVSPAAIWERVHDLLAYRSALTAMAPLELAVALAALGLGLRALVRTLRGRPEGEWPLVVLLCVAVLPFAAAVGAGLLIDKDLFYEARFFALSVPALIALVAIAAARLASGDRPRLLRLAPAGALLAAFLTAQSGSLLFLYGGGRSADNYPIEDVITHFGHKARSGDLVVVHSSWYLPYYRRYCHRPRLRFLGVVNEEVIDAPNGGMSLPTTPQDVEDLLARLPGRGRLFLVLSPVVLAEWRDPKGLVEAALDSRYALLDPKVCYGCNTGYSAVIKLYDLGRPPRARPRGQPSTPGT